MTHEKIPLYLKNILKNKNLRGKKLYFMTNLKFASSFTNLVHLLNRKHVWSMKVEYFSIQTNKLEARGQHEIAKLFTRILFETLYIDLVLTIHHFLPNGTSWIMVQIWFLFLFTWIFARYVLTHLRIVFYDWKYYFLIIIYQPEIIVIIN